MRRGTVGVVLISALAGLGCNTAAEAQEAADLALAEDAFVRRARTRPERQVAHEVEQDAGVESASMQSDLTRTREKHQRALAVKLVDLDLDIAKLASRARMKGPEGRRQSERVLADIRGKRERLDHSIRALGPMVAEEWSGSRVAVDREWIELSQQVSLAFVSADLRVQSN